MSFISNLAGGTTHVTNVNSDNVSSTNISTVNLTTVTFSPTNVNATTIIATESDIDLMNASTINTSVINSSTNTAVTGTFTTLNSNTTNTSIYNSSQTRTNDLLLLSTSGTSGEMNKVGTNLQIKTGVGVGSQMVFTANTNTSMLYDGDLNLLSKLKLTNLANESATIQHNGTNLNVIANNNTSSDINFFTDSLGVNKLHIKKNTDEIEVKNLKVLGTTDTNSVISNQLNVTNATGQSALFKHDGQELNITSNMSVGTPSDIHFFTEPNQPSKLSILRSTDTVQMINLNVQDGIECSDILTEDIICNDINTSNISTINISVSTNALFSTTASIGSNSTNFNFNSSNDYKFSTPSAQESVFFREGLGYGLIETDRINISTINSSALVTDALTITNITVNNELDFGSNDSKIWSASNAFHFQSGATLSGKEFKFQTGGANEVVYFKAGQGKGVIETDLVNCSDITVETVTTKAVNGTVTSPFFVSNDSFRLNNIASGSSLFTNYHTSGSSYDPLPDIVFPAFNLFSSTFSHYNIYNMMAFFNAQSRSSRRIEVDCVFVVNNVFTLKESGAELNEYYSTPLNKFIKTSSSTSDYDMFGMLKFTNNATPANGSIESVVQLNVNNNLLVNGVNVITEIGTKQDLLTAGTNITIANNVISASGTATAYTGGTDITVDANNVISYTGTTPVVYTAGPNITITAADVVETVLNPDFDQVDAGVTSIGGGGTAAIFHHKSKGGFPDWAFLQYATGVTILNASTGQPLCFRQGQINKATIDGTTGEFSIMRNGTLSNLPTELDQIQADLVTKQVQLIAGANIALDSYGNIASTDTTYTAGANIAISATNVISAPTPLDRINFYKRGSSRGIPNGTVNYYLDDFITDYNNLSISYTNQIGGNSDGWALPQGVFKIEYKCCIDQGGYNNRLGCLTTFFLNGTAELPSQSFGYARDASYIDRQTMSSQVVVTVPAGGEYLSIRHNCNRNGSSYTSTWSDGASISGMCLIITKLD